MSRFVVFIEKNKARHCLLLAPTTPTTRMQTCAWPRERHILCTQAITAKSATCAFPVANNCCNWFLLTCRIYVSSLMLLNCACESCCHVSRRSRTPVTGCQASQVLRSASKLPTDAGFGVVSPTCLPVSQSLSDAML